MEDYTWLKDGIAHIQETARPLFLNRGGHDFALFPNGKVTELIPEYPHPDTLRLYSLDAMVQLIVSEAAPKAQGPLYIIIPDHLSVECFESPKAEPEARGYRHLHYVAKATDVPGWESKVTLGFEEMQIALRTRFQESADTLYVQQLLSSLTNGAKVTYNDNGVATTVVTQKGVALQSSETIRPIVTLKPYRTFQELEQPESTFLIRVSERGISLIDADGGMWKLHARQLIKNYLSDALAEQNVIVTL